MQVIEDKICFNTANFVGRALDYSLKPFNWGQADEATRRLFHGDSFQEEFSEIMRIISDAGFKMIASGEECLEVIKVLDAIKESNAAK